MKKKFFIFLIIFSCILTGSFSLSASIFAEGVQITNLTSTITFTNDAEVDKEENKYILNFIKKDMPYNDIKMNINIKLSLGMTWETLDPMAKLNLAQNLRVFINDEEITLSPSSSSLTATLEYMAIDITLAPNGADAILKILKPGTYKIKVSATESVYTEETIMAKYAPVEDNALTLLFNNNKIPQNNKIDINYNEFTESKITAKLEPEGFIDLSTIEFIWKINNIVDKQQTTSEYLLKEISIGTTEIICKATDTKSGLSTSKQLIIQTTHSGDINITITNDGPLEQTLGTEEIRPTTLTAQFPVVDETSYSIDWYLKSPNRHKYVKVAKNNNAYTFNPLTYNAPGEYKIFATVIYKENLIESKTIKITLVAQEIPLTPNSLEIMVKTEQSKETGLDSYKLSVDTENKVDPNRIIWYVSSKDSVAQAVKIGTTFEFKPELATQYIITVRLLSKDGFSLEKGILASKELTPQKLQEATIYLYIGLAFLAVIILSTISIIVSNKIREKIW